MNNKTTTSLSGSTSLSNNNNTTLISSGNNTFTAMYDPFSKIEGLKNKQRVYDLYFLDKIDKVEVINLTEMLKDNETLAIEIITNLENKKAED